MNSNNRITYRFDRKGQAINDVSKESDSKQDVVTSVASTKTSAHTDSNKQIKTNVVPLFSSNELPDRSQMHPWNSPFQEDIGALEQLIRNTDMKPTRVVKGSSEASTEAPAPTPTATSTPTPTPALSPMPVQYVEHEKWPEHTNQADVQPNANLTRDSAREPRRADMEAEEGKAMLMNDDYDIHRKTAFKVSRVHKTSRGPSWFNVFLSVTGALATGALFGYLLLSLFTGATIWPGGSTNNQQAEPVAGTIINGNTSDPNENFADPEAGAIILPNKEVNQSDDDSTKVPMVSLSGVDQSYYFLQFGVFSNKEGRDAALGQLTERGLAAAAMKTEKDFRVYAGMAGDHDKATLLKAQMPELDLYVKELTIQMPKKLPYSGDAASAQSFFEQTNALVQIMDGLAAAQLEQPTLFSLSKEAAGVWQAKHQKWTESAATMQAGTVDAAGKEYLKAIILSINTAAKAMLEYDKKPLKVHLWSTQSALMEAIITQKQWFETNSAL